MMIPKFNKYACFGDSITWQSGPFEMVAYLEPDNDTAPTDYGCYSDVMIEAWNADEWAFCGVVVTASIADTILGTASLWGIEMNLPDGTNKYLSTIAGELEPEAIAEATAKIKAINRLGERVA